MLKERRQTLLLGLIVSDSLAAVVAWVLAYVVRFHINILPEPTGIPPVEPYLWLLIPLLLFQLLALKISGLYRYGPQRSRTDDFFSLVQGVSLTTLFLVAATFFIRSFSYSRLVMVVFWGLALAALSCTRGIVGYTIHWLHKHGKYLRNALVVGAGELGQTVTQRIHDHPEIGLRMVGYLDPIIPKGERVGAHEVLGGLEDVERVVAEHGVSQLFIALPLESHRHVLQVLGALEGGLVDVKVVPDLLQFVTFKAAVEELDGLPIISLGESPITGWSRVAKRVMDMGLSGAGLLLLSPLLGLIALAIKLSSHGPVLYTQERMGLDGKRFLMYKFRSMAVDAELSTGPVWASRDDERRTWIGKILRKTSLDELPQLWNVFRGEMSLVGPRPERPVFVYQFKQMIPQYMLRHKVKSGMTGWAQVNGWRGNTSIEKRIEYDIYYIENWSLAFDLKILWKTLWRAWVHRHAY